MTRSPFDGSGFRTDNPRRKRPCRECGRDYEATLRLPRCGDCHQQRLRQAEDQRTDSLSQVRD